MNGLKDNKYMAINIANVPGFKNLEEVVKDTAFKCGFIYNKTLKLALSNVTMKSNKSKFKYEPIFIFKKHPFHIKTRGKLWNTKVILFYYM